MSKQHPPPAVIVVMGVSGSGKTTVANALARQLGWEFEDADWFHPAANVEKMHSGVALTDEDRRPWLAAIARWIDATRAAGRHGIVTCSALKRRYRAILIGDRADVRRIATRHEHFMPASLLASQFEALEEPGPDEHPVVVSIEPSPREIVAHIIAALGLQAGAPQQPKSITNSR